MYSDAVCRRMRRYLHAEFIPVQGTHAELGQVAVPSVYTAVMVPSSCLGLAELGSVRVVRSNADTDRIHSQFHDPRHAIASNHPVPHRAAGVDGFGCSCRTVETGVKTKFIVVIGAGLAPSSRAQLPLQGSVQLKTEPELNDHVVSIREHVGVEGLVALAEPTLERTGPTLIEKVGKTLAAMMLISTIDLRLAMLLSCLLYYVVL